MAHQVIRTSVSGSFPDDHPILSSDEEANVLLIVGDDAGSAFAALGGRDRYDLILIELGLECLGVHTGEARGEEGGNVLGFARFRLGSLPPSDLVEVVRQPNSDPQAIDAARSLFARHDLKVAVCGDFPGRIVNRLIRPYYNAALDRLDAKLATAADLDTTLKLGLGYPSGPIELLEASGLAHHYRVTKSLYEALGDRAYFPARRAQVAEIRAGGE